MISIVAVTIGIIGLYLIGTLISLDRQNRKLRRKLSGIERRLIARDYVRGSGIEIGAFSSPLPVDTSQAHVRYVDRVTKDEIIKEFNKKRKLDRIVEVDIVDNGEELTKVPDSSQDFVIANHMLEHCQDPIKTLRNFFRVLRQGGILYLTIPDKRFNKYDRERTVTTAEHVVTDHEKGPGLSKEEHIREHTQMVDKLDPVKDREAYETKIAELLKTDPNLHYHAMTQKEMLEMLIILHRQYGIGFEFEHFYTNRYEVIFILRKT